MSEPTTQAGKALHEALRRGNIFVRSWDAEGKDYPDYAAPRIAAIEAEAAQLVAADPLILLRDTPEDRERLRVALDSVQQAENQEGLHVPLFLHVDAILSALRGEIGVEPPDRQVSPHRSDPE